MSPDLDRLYLRCAVSDEDFDPQSVLDCMGAKKASDEEDEEVWVGFLDVDSPEGAARVFSHSCKEDDDHSFHVSLDIRAGWNAKESDATAKSWSQLVDCFTSIPSRIGEEFIQAVLEYPSEHFESVLEDQKESFSHGDIGADVRLAGIELDFRDSDYPIDGLLVREHDNIIVVTLYLSRELDSEIGAYNKIFEEAVVIANTFVRAVSKDSVERIDNDKKQTDE